MRIKQHRFNNQLTQAQLASLMGVHVMTVSKWERGICKPSTTALRLLKIILRDNNKE